MYAYMYTLECVRLGLVLCRHPKINLFGLHYFVINFVVKWRQNRAFVGPAVIMECLVLDQVKNAEQFSPDKWQ